jgi:hypothetical protein
MVSLPKVYYVSSKDSSSIACGVVDITLDGRSFEDTVDSLATSDVEEVNIDSGIRAYKEIRDKYADIDNYFLVNYFYYNPDNDTLLIVLTKQTKKPGQSYGLAFPCQNIEIKTE